MPQAGVCAAVSRRLLVDAFARGNCPANNRVARWLAQSPTLVIVVKLSSALLFGGGATAAETLTCPVLITNLVSVVAIVWPFLSPSGCT
jgi:hypothetical protein